MGNHFESILASVGTESRFVVNGEHPERVDGNQNVTDIGLHQDPPMSTSRLQRGRESWKAYVNFGIFESANKTISQFRAFHRLEYKRHTVSSNCHLYSRY